MNIKTKNLKLYVTSWCYASRNIKAFLDQQKIEYDYIDIDEDKAGEAFVLATNNGYRSVPTLLFPDGSTLTEPSLNQLREKLGLLG